MEQELSLHVIGIIIVVLNNYSLILVLNLTMFIFLLSILFANP